MCKSKVVRLLNILEPAAAESEQASAVVTLTGINMHCGTSASWYARVLRIRLDYFFVYTCFTKHDKKVVVADQSNIQPVL